MSPLYDVFRFDEAENIRFWNQYYAATTWHKYMKQVANYGARHDRMAISSVDFFSMPLPYPHPAEQQKIADFLSAIDHKIDLVAQELAHAQSFKAGLLQQMFV
jgi:type I restriction enzyme S subunit